MIYKTALGIETGDTLINTSGRELGIIDAIKPPKYVHIDHLGNVFVREYPTTTLSGLYHDKPEDRWVVHEVIHHPEQGYLSQKEPIQIIKPVTRPQMAIDMFASYLDNHIDQPYQFQEDVDYETVDPWHCSTCQLDFNAPPYEHNRYNTACPQCGKSTNKHVFVMAKTALGEGVVGINRSTFNPWQKTS